MDVAVTISIAEITLIDASRDNRFIQIDLLLLAKRPDTVADNDAFRFQNVYNGVPFGMVNHARHSRESHHQQKGQNPAEAVSARDERKHRANY